MTATENILMAAVMAKGETVIFNAACEPHVSDLANMLNAMGARIGGIGTNRLEVVGVDSLHGCSARVGCDYIEAGSYIAATAATGGSIVLTDIDPEPFEVLAGAFARFGVRWTVDASGRTLRCRGRVRPTMKYDLGDAIPSVADGTWPAFPSDLMSVLIVLATQTRIAPVLRRPAPANGGAHRAVRSAPRRRNGPDEAFRRIGRVQRHTGWHSARDRRPVRRRRVRDRRGGDD